MQNVILHQGNEMKLSFLLVWKHFNGLNRHKISQRVIFLLNIWLILLLFKEKILTLIHRAILLQTCNSPNCPSSTEHFNVLLFPLLERERERHFGRTPHDWYTQETTVSAWHVLFFQVLLFSNLLSLPAPRPSGISWFKDKCWLSVGHCLELT